MILKSIVFIEIVRKYYIAPRTDKKYANSDTKLIYRLSNPNLSKLNPHKALVYVLLEEAPKVQLDYMLNF